MNNQMEKACYHILLGAGLLPKKVLDDTFQLAERSSLSFSQMLVKQGLIKEIEILDIYAKNLGKQRIDLKKMEVDVKAIKKVPIKFAWYYRFFPVALNQRKLTIAVSQLLDVSTLDEIRLSLGCEIDLALAPEADVEEMLKRHYGLGADTVEKMLAHETATRPEMSAAQVSPEIEDIEKLAETASVAQLVNQIIFDAYKKRASDIHIEPYRGKIRIRYRIDGVLHEAPVSPEMKQFLQAILSRIKIMANLNIVEKRLPQDGKAHVKTQDESLDLRVSCIPTPQGESMVVRILPKTMVFQLEKLGFDPDQLTTFKALIERPHGIIFVTGPTGSGKSTTLYGALHSINTVKRKVITIEDPIEYEMEGMTQIQVMPNIGLSFAQGLRSMLRHDPDVMMVGEVRDAETADIAVRAALTGHLILSTLHTNDVASSVTRLLDIGCAPYLVASSVNAFIGQRLVRLICPNCKDEDTRVPEETKKLIARELGLSPQIPVRAWIGRGCDHCNGTGCAGRSAIHEMLIVNDNIRALILKQAPAREIRQAMKLLGMKSLRQNGWQQVLEGITTVQEIIEKTPEEEMVESGAVAENVREEVAADSGASNDAEVEEFFKERRKYERVRLKFHISYRVIDFEEAPESAKGQMSDGTKQGDGLTQDVSASGVRFLSNERLRIGGVVDLSIDLPDGRPPIRCLARVLRSDTFKSGEEKERTYMSQHAVTFLAINSNDRLRLENFCRARG